MLQENQLKKGDPYVLLTQSYVVLMLCVFPLYFHNKYFDIMGAKRLFFLIVSTGYFCLMLLAFFFQKYREKKKRVYDVWQKLFLGMALIEVIALFTGMFRSSNSMEVFFVPNGRCVGVLVLLLGIATIFVVGKYCILRQWMIVVILMSWGIIWLLQILNTFQIDPLGMSLRVVEIDKERFISTLGNKNFNAGFDAFIVPIVMCLFLRCKVKKEKLCYGLLLVLGFAGGLCCRSDSVYLGLAAAFLVLFFLWVKNSDDFLEYIKLIIVFCCSNLMIAGAAHLFPPNHGYEFQGLSMLLTENPMIMMQLFLVIVGALIICICNYKYFWFSMKYFKRTAGVILSVFFAGIVVLFLWVNLFQKVSIKPYSPLSGLIFSDEWGNHRGYIWKRAGIFFEQSSLGDKMFGCGMGNFKYVIDRAFGDEMRQYFNGTVFIDPHNEFLQYLVSTGIVGIIGYFGMIVVLLCKCMKRYVRDDRCIFGIVGIIAFLTQGLVNCPQIVTTPLAFVLLGLFYLESR